MDPSQQDHPAPPLHLASLTSTESQLQQQQQQQQQQHIKQQLSNNKVQPLSTSESNEKILGLSDDSKHAINHQQQFQQPPPQPQPQPQQLEPTTQGQQPVPQHTQGQPPSLESHGDGAKKAAELPFTTQSPSRRFKLANLVDRVRIAQQQEQQQAQQSQGQTSQQPTAAATEGGTHQNHHHLDLFPSHSSDPERHPSDQDHLIPTGGHARPADVSRRPSSIIYNVTETPEQDGHQHHHLHLHHHNTGDGGDAASATKKPHPAVLFPKIFSKDGVRNALFLNSAATAFTKPNRTKNLGNIDIPVASLAVTGSAVPALWLRRDDKGRRPPPVIFQMLKIAVTDSEIDLGVSKQIIFRVELQYGDVKWVIRRTLYEFYKLHLILAAKRFDNLPKFPGQLSYAFSMAKASLGMKNEDKVNYVRQSNLARRHALQNYLLQLLQQLNWTIAYDLYEFLEISAMSLTKDMGWKGKEAYVDTKVTDRIHSMCGFNGFSRWDKNWALLRDSYMAFCSTVGSDEPTDVFIFDQNFFVQHKEHALGLNMHHIEIGNSLRKIEIRGDHNREMVEWMEHFTKMKQSSPWVNSHRFGSFAPQREDAKIRYYVDGKDYFHAVSDAILAAKTEIYICDWWLSPELYLRRPPEKNEEFRLDRLLKRKAMEGVMIYIVVYKEIALALSLDSAHTKIWLQDLHPNIQVQRHPDHISVNATQFWAHHEKMCVVDCRLAFIGGLDLCFGRYDSRTHQLADYHPSRQGTIWPGQDYSNPRIKDFVNVKDYNNDLIEKRLLARMPWHDVSVGMAGQPARDVARHFVQRWNFVKKEKGMKKSHMKFLTPKGEFVSTRNESGWTGSQKVQILRSSTLWSQGVDMERSIQNAYLSSIEKAEHFIYIENQFFVTLAVENGNPDIKNKIGIALVDRILRAHQEGKKFRVIVVMPLMPAFEADIMSSEAGTLRKVMHFQYVSICRGGNSVLERLIANGVDPDQYIGFFGLRSFDRIKHGKFDAIVEAVKEAEAEQRIEKAKSIRKQKRQEEGLAGDSEDSTADDDSQEGDSKVPKRLSRGQSLASRYLLEPIPKDAEAERIKAIADQRRAIDVLKTWDESITKRAMNPAMKELGYVPAATESSLADTLRTAEIQNDTDEAEIVAGHKHYRKTGRTSPELIDGFGTKVRTAIEWVKGDKENGDLEPMHRRLSRNPRFQQLRHPRSYQDDDEDSVQGEQRQLPEGYMRGYEDVAEKLKEKMSIKEDGEFITEGGPSESQGGSSTDDAADQEETADPSKFPKADAPGPVKVEKPIVDDEVNDFVTEQLYIHSKLMIVDDRIIICGSANINDRSQVGFRDSEIAIIIEDTEMIPTRMNGEPYQAGKLAHTLRADLFKEHLGLLPHVEHDVVTKASVLPVDLNAPNKDPEQARLELIRKANEQQQQQQQQQLQFEGPQGVPQSQLQQPQDEIQPQLLVDSSDSTAHTQSQTHEPQPQPLNHTRSHSLGQGLRTHHQFNDGTGHLQVYTPNTEESQAINTWHASHTEHGSAKQAAAEDPSTADEIVVDPLHDDFYDGWWKRVAMTNTEIFREVFRCVPDDTVETWDEYRAFVPNPKKVLTGHVAMEDATVENVNERLQKVTGHLVEFPSRFLCKENLLGGVVEGAVVPMEIFT